MQASLKIEVARLTGVAVLYRRWSNRDDLVLAAIERYRRTHIPPAVLAMPFDLMRHDLLMTLSNVPPERIKSIVDDLFLPLVAKNINFHQEIGVNLRSSMP
jgi:AcrR family transcriptional regulator